MASIEQREAVRRVRDWYRGNEDLLGLKRGSTRNFSYIRSRRIEALRISAGEVVVSESAQSESSSDHISWSDFRTIATRVGEFYRRAIVLSRNVVKYPHAGTS